MDNERKKIIVVDDNLENLTVLKDTLKNVYEVYPCPSAFKMFDLLEHVQPDLMDIEMPEMDGFEAIQLLKSQPGTKSIPVIFLSSHIEPYYKRMALSLGAVDYIVKANKGAFAQLCDSSMNMATSSASTFGLK